MKTQTLGLLAILSLGIGLTSFSSTGLFQESDDITSYGQNIGLSGHVTVIHANEQGDILGYQQYDNIILNEGLDCITALAFNALNSTQCSVPSSTDKFTFIGLLGTLTGTDPASDSTAASLTEITGNNLDPVVATTIGVDVEAAGATTVQGTSVTALQHTFTKANVGGVTVGGAVLENAAGNAIFAAKAFGADIELNESDTLEITWSITLG